MISVNIEYFLFGENNFLDGDLFFLDTESFHLSVGSLT